jgi:hypothetical protein
MAFDVVDDVGNVQHRVAQVSKDVILWGDAGISAWAGAFVVPAVEDIYLFSPDGTTQVVSEAIRPLYRSYVRAGYQPGAATVHRGHYLLPILNGTALVDELVCRLDRPYQTPGGGRSGRSRAGRARPRARRTRSASALRRAPRNSSASAA